MVHPEGSDQLHDIKAGMSLDCQHSSKFIIYLYEKQGTDHAVYHFLQIYFQIMELVMCI